MPFETNMCEKKEIKNTFAPVSDRHNITHWLMKQ